MALLAQCPSCDCELELPSADGQVSDDLRMECPACSHVFTAAEASPRQIMSARLIDVPNVAAEQSSLTDSAVEGSADPKFGAATLASFLGSDATADQPATDGSAPESTEKYNLGEYKSLDELFNKVAPGPAPSTSEDSTIEDDGFRPTFEAMVGDPTISPTEASPADSESELIDDLVDSLDDFEATTETMESGTEQGHDPLANTFDFGAQDAASEPAQGLRASMGFGPGDVLEEQQVTVDTGEPVQEAHFGDVDAAPSGTVPMRRRSSSPSIARTMIGVVGGGVVALMVSPLAVMWINHFRGVNLDPFNAAMYYPDVIKPAEFRSTATLTNNEQPSPPSGGRIANDTNRSGVVPSTFEESQPPRPTERPNRWDNDSTPAEPMPKQEVTVEGAPKYAAAQIMQWTSDAEKATRGLLEGNYEDRKTHGKKGGSYAQIAMLADGLTFGEGPRNASWLENARKVFPPLYTTSKDRYEVSLIASIWLTTSARKHGGIFFCGTPDSGRQQGSVSEYVFTLPTPARQQLTVLTPKPLNSAQRAGISTAVIGSIVDDPAERIEGYTGNAKRVVWAPNAFAIRD